MKLFFSMFLLPCSTDESKTSKNQANNVAVDDMNGINGNFDTMISNVHTGENRENRLTSVCMFVFAILTIKVVLELWIDALVIHQYTRNNLPYKAMYSNMSHIIADV